MMTLQERLRAQDMKVLKALAENMTLAGSNDVSDNFYWLQEHYEVVGVAGTVEWYTRCAIANEHGIGPEYLNWKQGIVDARKAKIS